MAYRLYKVLNSPTVRDLRGKVPPALHTLLSCMGDFCHPPSARRGHWEGSTQSLVYTAPNNPRTTLPC